MKKLLHKLFGIGAHHWRKARLTEDRDLKYCPCGASRTVKHRAKADSMVIKPRAA